MSEPTELATWVLAPTEERNPNTVDIDLVSTLDMLLLINNEDTKVPTAVRAALGELAVAVDLATDALRAGHRVHYFGAGTSGRLAVMDAAELVPTYALDPALVVAHHAGGQDALDRPVEDVEDDEAGAAADAAAVGAGDIAVGLSASGRTPYVMEALRVARQNGARTVLISANPEARAAVDAHVAVDTGPEVVAGSTRMKAGTAQKLLLNAFSTALMVRMDRTYSNLMVAVATNNAKLRGRVIRILVEATGLDVATCAAAAERADGDCRLALVSLLAGVPVAAARRALDENGGGVRRALAALGDGAPTNTSPKSTDGTSPKSTDGTSPRSTDGTSPRSLEGPLPL